MQTQRLETWRTVAFYVAFVGTALALGGALAHAFEYFNKMPMSEADYFVTQRAYDGWNQLAYALLLELAGLIALAVLYRGQPRVLRAVLLALAGFAGAQIIFWVWTAPANAATQNWTMQPENWEAVRAQWENSHFAGAVFQFIAMMGLVTAALRRG